MNYISNIAARTIAPVAVLLLLLVLIAAVVAASAVGLLAVTIVIAVAIIEFDSHDPGFLEHDLQRLLLRLGAAAAGNLRHQEVCQVAENAAEG